MVGSSIQVSGTPHIGIPTHGLEGFLQSNPKSYYRREYRKDGGLLREFWYRPGGHERSKSYYPRGAVHIVEETTHYELSKRVVYSEDGEVLSSYEHTPRTLWIFDACAVAFVVAVGWYVAGVVRSLRKNSRQKG